MSVPSALRGGEQQMDTLTDERAGHDGYKRTPEALAGLHFVAFAMSMLAELIVPSTGWCKSA